MPEWHNHHHHACNTLPPGPKQSHCQWPDPGILFLSTYHDAAPFAQATPNHRISSDSEKQRDPRHHAFTLHAVFVRQRPFLVTVIFKFIRIKNVAVEGHWSLVKITDKIQIKHRRVLYKAIAPWDETWNSNINGIVRLEIMFHSFQEPKNFTWFYFFNKLFIHWV